MLDVETSFNLCEGTLWTVIGIILYFRTRGQSHQLELLGSLTAIDFLVFGLSDYVEIRTGAWWDPPLLFILKVVCVIGFVVAGVRYRWLQRNDPAKSLEPHGS